MSDDTVIDRDSVRHAYEQIADAIAARIATGVYTARLPGGLELAEESGVSYPTMRHATATLRERGLIIAKQGRGTFVASWVAEKTADRTRCQPSGPG